MRARNIKASFFENEELAELDIPTRLLFIGLWCVADREGRLEDRPKRIQGHLFRWDQKVDIDTMLNDLQKKEFIIRYKHREARYIEIVNFKKHQHPHKNESPSIIPKFEPTPENLKKTLKNTEKQPNKHTSIVIGTFTEPIEPRSQAHGLINDSLNPERGMMNPDSKEVAEQPATPTSTPQALFIQGFKRTYETMTQQPFKAGAAQYKIAADLIRANGFEVVVSKARILGLLCENRAAWFTKGGWSDFTLETLTSKWNSILEDIKPDPQEVKDREFLKELRKAEEKNGRIDSTVNPR